MFWSSNGWWSFAIFSYVVFILEYLVKPFPWESWMLIPLGLFLGWDLVPQRCLSVSCLLPGSSGRSRRRQKRLRYSVWKFPVVPHFQFSTTTHSGAWCSPVQRDTLFDFLQRKNLESSLGARMCMCLLLSPTSFLCPISIHIWDFESMCSVNEDDYQLSTAPASNLAFLGLLSHLTFMRYPASKIWLPFLSLPFFAFVG